MAGPRKVPGRAFTASCWTGDTGPIPFLFRCGPNVARPDVAQSEGRPATGADHYPWAANAAAINRASRR